MEGAALDVLVIGGGITGAGVALDAALRGLRTGLVEQHDFASGTSSRSSKMIHGGLRYLATGDVRLVREALFERRSIQRRAAHLVRPLPMLLPVFTRRDRMRLGTGLWLYDLLGAWRAGSRHTFVRPADVTRAVPNINADGLRGGLGYFDSQADDVRLVLAVLRSALRSGALIANGTRVVRLLEHGGRVSGAVVDAGADAGGERELRARVVVNAAGVWADRVFAGAGVEPGFALLPSKGIHITVPRDVVGIESGVAFFGQTDNANVFVEPWQHDLAIVGTSDAPHSGPLEDPVASEEEIATLLGAVNPFLARPIPRGQVVASFAGLRPLVNDAPADGEGSGPATPRKSRDVSRRHRTVVRAGMVTMVGGKLTTYRQMAQDAVDAAVKQLGAGARRCSTADVLLEGARLEAAPSVDDVVREIGVSRTTARHLLRRYGSRTRTIVELCAEQPDLREPLHPDRPYIAAEAAYGVRYEMARNVEDVLARRTRLALETRDGGKQAREIVESILAAHAAAELR
jgi:glycerol-3-phosphate dehydrogenase